MEKKILIATHGKMASGVKNTLSLFVDVSNIKTINAYIDDGDWAAEIYDFINDVKNDEIGIIFTDILGGSVNQKALLINNKSNVSIIAGFNIPLIMEIILTEINNENDLRRIIEEAKKQIQLVELIKIKDENENSFLE